MSAEGSQNVPQNIISEKDDWVILTWKLHHLFTKPWYHSILTDILLILGFCSNEIFEYKYISLFGNSIVI